MGFLGDIFGTGPGSYNYQAQSGLQPGQLQQTYEQQQQALQRMMDFVAATQPGATQGLAAQQDLTRQLQAMGRGEGPSAAQAMLQQQAGDIAAQQAALMGSQRGASQNVGLIGRQSAQAGMQAQQRAGSQAAILRQQEQLGALEQLRAQTAQQVQQQQQAGAQAGQATLQAQQQALAAQQAQEAQRVAMASQKEATRGGISTGFMSAVSPFAAGGEVKESLPSLADFLNAAHGSIVPGKAKVDGDSFKNDTVPALLSPGEIVIPRSAAKDPDKAAAFAKSVAMRARKKRK